jgi:hypothetical protein
MHHHNGNVHHPQCQAQAIENVYYWYDGNVPFCTDATACRPLDDNFLPMNVHGYGYGYWYADKTQWAPLHQVIASLYFSQPNTRLTTRVNAAHERQSLGQHAGVLGSLRHASTSPPSTLHQRLIVRTRSNAQFTHLDLHPNS